MKQKTVTASEILSDIVVRGIQEKKGISIVKMDLREIKGSITDFFVICSGTSDRHVQAIADSVRDMTKKELKDRPINVEGEKLGEWVLMDYVNVVVHIFLQEKREFYDIEGLWGDAPREEIEDTL